MSISDDRISHLAHQVLEKIWRDDLADVPDDGRALTCVKKSIATFFRLTDEIDGTVRQRLRSKTPGSREWDLLYQKFFQEELARRSG